MQNRIKGSLLYALPFVILGGAAFHTAPARALVMQDAKE